MRWGAAAIIIPLILYCAAPGALSRERDATRRFAIVVGANNGGHKRVRLRYAVSDANSVMNVLKDLGGVDRNDAVLLVEPDSKKFISEMKGLKQRIDRARSDSRRVEVVFYYSGHSDGQGILLGRERVLYRDIKKNIKAMNADVRIAILDSCSSGAFTRIKGGKMRSPFLLDSAYDMKGYAFMTSSSYDEASQESDLLRGSFFTHYLISGMRGAADVTSDRRITLSEAYQFAYKETLARTEKTLSGPQHPNYHIRMTGTGDVIMTDIRSSSSALLLHKNISGRLFVRDRNSNLVAELNKPAGKSMELGLDRGTYTVTNERGGKLYRADITVDRGGRRMLAAGNFRVQTREMTRERGGVDAYRVVPLHMSLVDFPSPGTRATHKISLHLISSYCTRLDGYSLGLGIAMVQEDVTGVQLSLIGNMAGGNVRYLQGAMIFNVAGEDFRGVQYSSVYNYTGGNLSGVGVSGVFNYVARDTRGLLLGTVFNYSGRDMSGVQASGILNITRGSTSGVQVASILNKTGEDVSGLQLSVVNIGRKVRGMQIGIVNISDEISGVPLGLVNIIRKGMTNYELWGDENGIMRAGIKHGNRRFYSLYSAGTGISSDILSLGFNFGSRFYAGKFTISADMGAHNIYSRDMVTDLSGLLHAQIRACAGYRIFKKLALFGGVSYNYAYAHDPDKSISLPESFIGYGSDLGAGDRHRFWPGFFVGVQI